MPVAHEMSEIQSYSNTSNTNTYVFVLEKLVQLFTQEMENRLTFSDHSIQHETAFEELAIHILM